MSKTLTERVTVLETTVEQGFKHMGKAIHELKINDFHELKEEMKASRVCMASLKKESAKTNTEVAKTGINVNWLMKNYWVVASASIGTFIALVLSFIFK